MIELLLELICCKKGGASKSDIVQIMEKFGIKRYEIESIFTRIHYSRMKSDSFSIILLNEKRKWETFDNSEYCKSILREIKDNPNDISEKIWGIPYWIVEKSNLLHSVFGNYNVA